jgi:hypothetical protein
MPIHGGCQAFSRFTVFLVLQFSIKIPMKAAGFEAFETTFAIFFRYFLWEII